MSTRGKYVVLRPSIDDRQNGVREALAKWRLRCPSPTIGDYFEHDNQRWTVIGFDRRHVPNRPARVVALVIESACHTCGEEYEIALTPWHLSPSPSCPRHAGAYEAARRQMLHQDGLPHKLREMLSEAALVRESMSQADFAAAALPLVKGKRREQKLADAIRNLAKRNQLPDGVTLTPSGFRFD